MKGLGRLISRVKKDKDILAVILFGSYARGERHRDIDICLVLNRKLKKTAMSRKRVVYMSESDFDLHIFQQIPIYIRVRVLKEGKIIFCRDIDALYDIAGQTAKEFAYFKPAYESYLEAVKYG
ncbi:MAG: nucleotidyltransferase domain-containing protein [Candidatus Aenigmatarchaeota archaeon]